MPPLLVHASLEHIGAAWGGISSAIDLLVTASSMAGQPTAVLSIGETDHTAPLMSGAMLYVVGIPELQGTVLYQHPERVRLGRLACERMAHRLADLRDGAEVDLCVHNDELAYLAEICSAKPWQRACVAFIHGLARQEHPQRPDLHRQQDDLVGRLESVAVFTHAYAKTVSQYYPNIRHLEVITPPLALLPAQEARRRLRRATTAVVGTVLAAGRGTPQKGFDILLRALSLVPPASVRTATLVIGHGNPDYEQSCATLAAQASSPVLLRTWTGRADLLDIMVKAGVVVVPSRFEPLGLVAAEALALGVPVVVSSVGGLTELVSDRSLGWAVPAAEGMGPAPQDLADAVATAASAAIMLSPGPQYLEKWRVDACITELAHLLERS